MQAETNGFSTTVSFNARSYRMTVKTGDYLKLCTKIRDWIKESKIEFTIFVSRTDHLTVDELENCFFIQGEILSDLYNDDTAFQNLHNLAQSLCISFTQDVIWNFNGETYKTKPKKKKE